MTIAFMVDPGTAKVAIFDEASGGGSYSSINSDRNRPLKTPKSWLPNIYFHSDLDIMEVVSDTTVSVNHAAVPASTSGGIDGGGGSAGGGGSKHATDLRFRASTANRRLVTHNLGYIPDCMAVRGSDVLFPGMPVQTQSDGRGRYCTLYVTETQVRLYEWTSVSTEALPAVTRSYRVIVFRQPRDPSGSILFDFDPSTGRVKMARGRFDSSRNYLQVVPGGSPFGIAYGKTMSLKNGAARVVNPNGTVFEPTPSSMKGKFRLTYYDNNVQKTFDPGYGSSMAYNGSFSGPERILVQVP